MARVKMTPDRLKELGITMEDVRNYRKHMGTIRRCSRDGGSKYKSKEEYDEYEGAAKWKRQNEAKEARKRKRAERKNVTGTVSKKRKGEFQVDGDSSSESSGTQKAKKVAAKKQGKAKVVVSDSSGGDDRGWKPSDSDHGSSKGNEEEDDIVGEGKRMAKLYKKLKKVHRRPNMVPEAKADYNQSTLEDYDVRLVGRSLCKMSTIRLDTFEEDFPFGISEILRPFRGLLELSLPYCESVVKVFYSNLKMSRGGVVSSCVRGQRIEVNDKNLLQWLNVKTPQSKDTSFSGDQMDNILLDGGRTDDDGALCRPKQLPYKYRVLHYLYSRNFVNKGKHYTTLSGDDKQILTCMIQRKPFNMGKRIVEIMLKASAMMKKNTDLPYPSVVSLILDKHKVWYLQDGEPPMWSMEFDDQALHRMQIPLDAIDRPRKSGSEGVKGVKEKAERRPTPSAKSGPSHVGEYGAAELGELFGQVLDEKLGVMKAELQSFIVDHVKGLVDLIHQYGVENRQSASVKASQDDHAGPSTKPVHSEHVEEDNSDDKSADSEDDSGTIMSHNDEEKQEEEEEFDGDANGSEGHTDATVEEENSSDSANGSEGDTPKKSGEVEVSVEIIGSEGETDGEEDDGDVSGSASMSNGHIHTEEEEEEVSGETSGSEGDTNEKEEDEEVHGSASGSQRDGNENEEEEEEEVDGSASGVQGDRNKNEEEEEEEVDGSASGGQGDRNKNKEEEEVHGGGSGCQGHTNEQEQDEAFHGDNKGTECDTEDEVMDEHGGGGGVKGTTSQTTDDNTSEQHHGGHDNVNEGPTAEKQFEEENVGGYNENEGPTAEELEPVTPLSLVTLPEPINPPPAPSRNIVDAVPLRFIPGTSFKSTLAAQNLPHIFSAEEPIPAPSTRPTTPMFIPVNLPGSRTSPLRRTSTRKSPAKTKKKK